METTTGGMPGEVSKTAILRIGVSVFLIHDYRSDPGHRCGARES